MKLGKKILLPILLGTTIVSSALSVAYYAIMSARIAEERGNASYSLAYSLLNILTFDYRVAGVVDSVRNTYASINPETYPTDEEEKEAYAAKYMEGFSNQSSANYELKNSYLTLVNTVHQVATVSDDVKSVLVAFVDTEKKRLVNIAGSDSVGEGAVSYEIGSWRDLSADCILLKSVTFKGFEEESEVAYQLDQGFSSKPIYVTALPFYHHGVAPQYANVLAYCIITQPERPTNNPILVGALSMIGASFATGLLLTLFLSLFLRKNVSQPIKKISAEAARVSESFLSGSSEGLSYAPSVSEKRNDEIKTVDESLGKMVVSARDALEKIKRNSNELEIASKIQLSSLPSPHEEGARLAIHGFMRPAKEVGGDFYDYFRLSGERYAILVADVSGKGVPAAMFMMRGKAVIKDRAYGALSLSSLFHDLNEELVTNNDENLFLTCFMAVIDLATKKMEYISAGHDPMVLLRDGKAKELHCDTNLVLGAVPGVEYVSETIEVEDRDLLFAYTDGLSEAMNDSEELFGKERILNALEDFHDENPEDAIAIIETKVKEFAGKAEQYDDMTMVCVKLKLDNQVVLSSADKALAEALDFASKKAKEAGCKDEDVALIETCVDEIVTNILNYGTTGKRPNIIIACFVPRDKSFIEFSIRDFGPAFNPLEIADPDVTLELDEREAGGLGLFLVKNIMDEVTYDRVDRENILTLRKKIAQ